VAWIETISDDQATGAIAKEFDASRKRAGQVFNIARAMSLNASTLRASMGLYLSTMHGRSALPRALREMIAIVVSLRNHCYY